MIVATEAVIYELTEKAGTEEFGKILEIVKERRTAYSSRSQSAEFSTGSAERGCSR